MAEDQDGKVSREAHERMTRERDELKAKVDKLNKVVQDVGYRDRARKFFKDKGVADPDWAAEFALPHLRTVELDSLDETLASDRFAPLVQMAVSKAPAPDDGEGSPEPDASATPPPSQTGFSGPNPGATGGAPETQKIAARELNNLPREEAQALIDADRVQFSSEPGSPIAISERFRGRPS